MIKNDRISMGIRLLVLVSFAVMVFLAGCTKRPNKEELTALDEACAAAKAAEQTLENLKSERMGLESELETKKSELRDLEEQRDAIKSKLEESIDEEAPVEE